MNQTPLSPSSLSPSAASLSPVSALLAHVEPLLLGRRVLVIGNAGNSVAPHLLERGARLAQVLDPDSRRVAVAAAQNTERRITFAQLTPHSLRDGSFDIAIVEDVELAENYQNLVLGIKRSLGSGGLAIFCARNSEGSSGLLGSSRGGVSYDDFSASLWDQFENVSIWGQSPFLGYSIVQFGLERPPVPVLDNGYVGTEGEPADLYIAICESSAATVRLSDMSIVQMPAARLLVESETGHREKERRAARRVETLEQELAQLRRQVSSSEVERLVTLLEERDRWILELESRTKAANTLAEDTLSDVEDLERELEETHSALLSQRSETTRAKEEQLNTQKLLSTAQEKVHRLTQELELAKKHETEITHLSAGRKALEDELNTLAQENSDLKKTVSHQSHTVDKLQKRIVALDVEVDELHKQLDETEDYLRDAEDELREAKIAVSQTTNTQPLEAEVAALELQLAERGQRVLELENQLRKLEHYSRTLQAELTVPAWAKEDSIQAEFDQLARTLAEREADLVEAEWTIGQLKLANKN